ncbi:MAG: hypothetical protein WCG84_03495 [Candidatus Moraniibacteriota bacterium]
MDEQVPGQESTKEEVKQEVTGAVNQLEAMLDEYLVKKAPFALPDNAKEFIVKVMPYVIIIFAVMAIPVILLGLGLSAVLAPVALLVGAAGGSFGVSIFINAVVSVVALVVELMAVKGLFARTKRGWRLVFYASIIGLIGSILSFNIINGILSAIIGWYFLFQVKEKYTN